MTNTELLAKIKAEIERRITDNTFGAKLELIDILAWLDTLESEKPMQEGLEEELERFIASGKSVTVDDYGTYKVSYHDFKKVARHFADWQNEQMMKEAIGGNAYPNDGEIWVDLARYGYKFKEGEPCRIIIVKED